MKSLSKLYRLGPGPSSSHTIAPFNAAKAFAAALPAGSDSIRATFYGSLALTGKGHHSEFAVDTAFAPLPVKLVFDVTTKKTHPLTMKFEAMKGAKVLKEATYISLGGGELLSHDDPSVNEKDIYPFHNFEEIKAYMAKAGINDLKTFCLDFEDPSIEAYLTVALTKMFSAVEDGLSKDGPIPANNNPKLQVSRSAKSMYGVAKAAVDEDAKRTLLISSYAYAVSEGSACGDEVVTAPTCGSSGVLPSVLYYMYKDRGVSFEACRDALYAAGIFGNLVKQNASIAGSIGGCQAEIGTASSMAAAALCFLSGLSLHQQEYAAEVAMEHFLGLSCDPVDGYVIIPCIERNGIGAIRAYTAFLYARYVAPIRQNKVSFDNVVAAMKLTGDSLKKAYKETAQGGLAEILKANQSGK
jgi:L-serine dehydratase